MGLFAAFAAASLLLAGLGLYALVAYGVAERRREIGIRIALGARRRQVLGLVLRRGVLLVGVGGLLGLTWALALTHLLRTLLFEISAQDPLTFVAVGGLLALVAALACLLPAHRATRVDPGIALQAD